MSQDTRLQIFTGEAIRQLYDDNSFLQLFRNLRAFIAEGGESVKMSQSRNAPKFVKNRLANGPYPASAVQGEFAQLSFDLTDYTSDMVVIPRLEEEWNMLNGGRYFQEIAFDWMQGLREFVANEVLTGLFADRQVKFNGALDTATAALPQGSYKTFDGTAGKTIADGIIDIQTLFAQQKVPMGERYMMPDPVLLGKIRKSQDFIDRDKINAANLGAEVVGSLYGFKVVDRAGVPQFKQTSNKWGALDLNAESTPSGAKRGIVFWQKDCFGYAPGRLIQHGPVDAPDYFGKAMSIQMWQGFVRLKPKNEGVAALIDVTA